MRLNSFLLLFFLILHFTSANAQSYLLSNESMVLSFETNKGKRMVLAQDTGNAYLVYRYGTDDVIELEFPSNKDTTSWNFFLLSTYFRGGGKANAGMDINHLSFINNFTEYTIFEDYFAESNTYEIGIEVKNLYNGKINRIQGKLKSKKGTLIKLGSSSQIKMSDDLDY